MMNLPNDLNSQYTQRKKLSNKYSKIWIMNVARVFMDIDGELKGKTDERHEEIYSLLTYLHDPQNNAWVSFARIWLDIEYRDSLLKMFFAKDPKSEKFVNERIQELIAQHYFFTIPPSNPN